MRISCITCFLDQLELIIPTARRHWLMLLAITVMHGHLHLYAQEAVANVGYPPNLTDLPNPERGLLRFPDCSNAPLHQAQLQEYRSTDGVTLVACIFFLSEFINLPVSQPRLDFFQRQMDTIRAAGMKAVLRFAYADEDTGIDAPLPVVQTHLDQLAPYLLQNRDVIAVVQAGFIGSWGEWGNSINFGVDPDLTPEQLAVRGAVLDKLLHVIPPERMVQLRAPRHKFNGIGDAAALLAADAFNGKAKARIGHHNDCFLGSDSDLGTYIDRQGEYSYLEAETLFLPMGGETCLHNPPRTSCAVALTELNVFHWTYLNADFNTIVLDSFVAQGCFNIIKQKLGYQFMLQQGSYPLSAKPGNAFQLTMVLRNEGWAAPFNARDVDLVLRNTANGTLHRFRLDTDPRKWLPGQSVTVSQAIPLPPDIPQGSYEILLHLADPMVTLRDRPEYAIQLANQGLWEGTTGFNKLNHVMGIAP